MGTEKSIPVTLKDKVIKSLGLTEKRFIERKLGGLHKFIDLGTIDVEMRIPVIHTAKKSNLPDNPDTNTLKQLMRNENMVNTLASPNKTVSLVTKSKNEVIKKVITKLKRDLADDYQKLTIETQLHKPPMSNTGRMQPFSVSIFVYGPGFEKIIRQVGKNRNVKYI